MIRAEISVSSEHISVASVIERLGALPDRVRNASDPPMFGSATTKRVNVWVQDLKVEAAHFGGDEGVSRHIEALGSPLAARLRGLANDGCTVTLGIVQEIEDPDRDRLSMGLHFTQGALGWLASAGATVDIDQYFG